MKAAPMTETQTVDLAAWLTGIWDARVKACEEAQEAIDAYTATAGQGDLELRWMLQLRKDGVFQGGWDMPGPPTPAEDLARIAADRKILASQLALYPEGCAPNSLVMKYLAEPYADRPGFREEWRA
jgi:hypothetical protein